MYLIKKRSLIIMGEDLRQLKWKSTAVNLRLFFRLFDNNTLKKTQVLECKNIPPAKLVC